MSGLHAISIEYCEVLVVVKFNIADENRIVILTVVMMMVVLPLCLIVLFLVVLVDVVKIFVTNRDVFFRCYLDFGKSNIVFLVNSTDTGDS